MFEPGRKPLILTARFRPYDGGAQNDSLFAQVRKTYFSSFRSTSGRFRGADDGTEIAIRYKISRSSFQWLKTSGKTVLQKSYRQKDGYSVITWNLSGEMIEKSIYNDEHIWQQNTYYCGDTAKPEALLKAGTGDSLILLQLEPDKQKYRQTELEACTYTPGTAEQSYIDSIAGEPQVFCETDAGRFCYCTVEEKEKRTALQNDFASEKVEVQPKWPEDKPAELTFHYIENKAESLPEPAGCPEPATSASKAALQRDYAVNHELFSIDEPKPMKYTVAVKGKDCGVQVGPAVPPTVQRAAKRIVISAEESYLYFGKVIDGLRQGQGRTQMPSGCTAYEGGYLDDKRNGFGVYHYKSGKVCYVGNWKDNQREGLGVAFRSSDDSIFVGKWKNNIPTGEGTAFNAEGRLIYSGEWKDGKRHGRGTEYRNGEIIYSGEFRNDLRYPAGN